MNTFESGVYRPPMHSFSLLLRVTENCPWNKCNFCMLYRGCQFKTRPVEDVLKDIDSMAEIKERVLSHVLPNGEFDTVSLNNEYFSLKTDKERECYAMVFNWAANGNMEAIFLQDGNTMVLQTEKLIKIVERISQKFPELKIIASYGRADSICRKSIEELKDLKAAGLNMIHSGFETCCDETLKVINKGFTVEQELEAGLKLKEAQMTINLFYMPGNGGIDLSEKNAFETAKVMKQINPEFIRIRTFMMKEGSPLYDMNNAGTFRNCTEDGKVRELRSFIDNLKGSTSYVISDHIINLLPYVEGYIDKRREDILNYMDEYFALPEYEKKRFQLARRLYYLDSWKNFDYLTQTQNNNIDYMIKSVPNDYAWEKLILSYASKMI